MKVCVLGLGYMGLPSASLLANAGYEVLGVDVDKTKIDKLKQGIVYIEEKGLKEEVQKALEGKKLSVSDSIEQSDVFLIAVPTPITESKKCDLKYVISAVEMIAKVLKKGDLVILESTVKPRTTLDVMMPILLKSRLTEEDFFVAHCPERAIPGNTMHELINNDRIIGGINVQSAKMTEDIYKKFIKGNIFLTDITTAETVKLMENTFRDVNIALANEFAKLAEELGINIWEAIALANKHPRVNVHKPGPGVGGHCISVDPWFLVEMSKSAELIKKAREINNNMPHLVFNKIKDLTKGIENPKITILGLAYKANVDDCRESPSLELIKLLEDDKFDVKINDPHVESMDGFILEEIDKAFSQSDCAVLITDHELYKTIITKKIVDSMRNKNLLDTRNMLSEEIKELFLKVKILGVNDENRNSAWNKA